MGNNIIVGVKTVYHQAGLYEGNISLLKKRHFWDFLAQILPWGSFLLRL